MGWFWAGLHACIAVRSISFNFILKLTPEQGSLQTLAEDDGRDHPAASTPGVVPAGPKRDGRAVSGKRASSLCSRHGTWRRAGNKRRTHLADLSDPSCVSRRTSDSPRIHGRRPSSAGQGHLHAPLQRGNRSPACGPPLPGAATRHAHPACRHFREQRFAPPTPRDSTSGGSSSCRLVRPEVRIQPRCVRRRLT